MVGLVKKVTGSFVLVGETARGNPTLILRVRVLGSLPSALYVVLGGELGLWVPGLYPSLMKPA